jgi:hypothetical protein
MEKIEKPLFKPTIRVNRYPNGYWCIIRGKAGVLSANRAEGIAKLKEVFPGDYLILDVNKPEQENPRMAETVNAEPVTEAVKME